MVKTSKKRYDWVDPCRKNRLLSLVASGTTIVEAARQTHINYGNAKWIVQTHRKRGLQKVQPRRWPRMSKIFAVTKSKDLAVGILKFDSNPKREQKKCMPVCISLSKSSDNSSPSQRLSTASSPLPSEYSS